MVSNDFGSVTSRVALVSVVAYHFSWNTIATPVAAHQPFLATITVRDINDDVCTNFNGNVSLGGTIEVLGRIQNASFESGTTTPTGWTAYAFGNFGQAPHSGSSGQMPTDGSKYEEIYTYNSGQHSFPMYVGNHCKVSQSVDLTGVSRSNPAAKPRPPLR